MPESITVSDLMHNAAELERERVQVEARQRVTRKLVAQRKAELMGNVSALALLVYGYRLQEERQKAADKIEAERLAKEQFNNLLTTDGKPIKKGLKKGPKFVMATPAMAQAAEKVVPLPEM